ncbi:uncharacterized protein LOC128348032 isoform X2 [Hemicordylus capensis]|uniref:uncharacterized protein LOC128348032 isoform X2 n=1 Tax=Hemicordylus capensis TaxID=884348 RepID=UPI00230335D3|nr:uncharacterized protein LOC128348032 isoform X2 [Hemicordylus capensis]
MRAGELKPGGRQSESSRAEATPASEGCSVLASMRDDSNLYEPLLEDGDDRRLIPVPRVSYVEKLWGILPQNFAASWLNFPNSIEYGMPCSSHKLTREKSTMTQATRFAAERRTWALILGFALLSLFLLVLLCFFYSFSICPLRKQQCPIEVNRTKAEENTIAAIVVMPEDLSVATLQEAREKEHLEAMRNCLDKAFEEFYQEPNMVKKNAKMVLQCNGTRREFLSGKGENHIEVVQINDKIDYILDEASPEVHMARLGRHSFPLNLISINEVLDDLASWEGSEELQACLNKALKEFPQEPMSVQDNASLVVVCGRKNLTFISGKGQNEINVYKEDTDEEIQYQVKATGWAWWARLFTRGAG